jgi:hypothetical protein
VAGVRSSHPALALDQGLRRLDRAPGGGLRTTVAFLRLALGVRRAEAARGSAEAARELDRDLLQEATRRADLLLLHLADPEALARRLSRGEAEAGPSAAW